MALGTAELQTSILTRQFEAQLSKLEKDAKASFTRMGAASDGIIDNRASANVKQLEAALKPLQAALRTTANEGAKVGDGLSTGAVKAKRELSPLKESIRGLANELNNYKVKLEAGEVEQADFVRGMQGVIANSKTLRDTVNQSSAEYGRLTNIIGTSTRSITTAEGRVSALGLSQQVALGSTQRLSGGIKTLGVGVVGLGNVLPGVIGVAGLGGLLSVSADLAKQADKTNIAQQVLNATIERTGQDAGAVQEAISNTAAALKLTDAQVSDSAATLLRLGLNAEQIESGLIAAGSSALAFGTTSAQGIESFTSALATGNSQALNTIGIAENIGKVMNEASEAHAGAGDSAQKQASATAGLNVVLKATESEVELLDTLTGGLAGKQADSARAAFEARQAFGEMLIPLETLKNEVLVGVLGQFTEMPSATQASVLGIGGVTTGVAALATGLTALRPLLALTFAPPAGLIIAGVAAAAALGTAIYTAAQAHETAAEKVDRLKGAAEDVLPALGDIKNATSKQQLLGSVETLAETMDGEARVAFVNYATTAVESAKTTGEAVQGVLQGVAAARVSLLEDAVAAQEVLLADLDRNLAESQTQFNIATATGGSGSESAELIRLREELSEVSAEYAESQQQYTQAVAEGNTDRAALYKADADEFKSIMTQITGEIGAALQNTASGRLTADSDARNAALRDLGGLQEQLGELQNLVQGGTADEIEAYFNAGSEGADRLTDSLDDVTDPINEAGDGAETSSEKLGGLTTELKGSATAATDFIDTLSQLSIDTVGEAAAQSRLDLEGLRGTIELNQRALESDVDATQAWGEVHERVYGAAGAAATEAAKLEQEAFFDRAKSRDAIVGANERAAESASVYDEAAQTVFTTQDAAIEQNGNSIASLRDLMTAQRDFNERLEVSGGIWKDVTPEASDFSDVLSGQQEQLRGASQALNVFADGVLADLPDAYRDAEEENDLFNTGLSDAEVRAEVAKEALQELIDAGLDPQSEAVQFARDQWLLYEGQVEAAATANENLTNLFAGLATAAGDALDLIPEKGTAARDSLEATGANVGLVETGLGALQGAAGAAQTALADGFQPAQDSVAIVGGLITGLADSLEDDIGPAAAGAVDAIGSIATGAAQGFATGGPLGAAIGGAIGLVEGLVGVFTRVQRAQEEVLRLQEETNQEIRETSDLLTEVADQNKEGLANSETAVLDARLELAIDSGDYEKGKSKGQLALAQLKVDLIGEFEEYQADIADAITRNTEIDTALRSIDEQLASGLATNGSALTEGQLADLRAQRQALLTEQGNVNTEINNYYEAYGLEVAGLLEQTGEIAKQMGLSQEELYSALLTGDDKILGQLTGEQQQALKGGIIAYYAAFGELPEGADEAAAALGISTDTLLTEMGASDSQLAAGAANGAAATRQAVAGLNQGLVDLFGPEKTAQIRAAILSLYSGQAKALEEGNQTVSTAATQSAPGPRQVIAGLNQQLVDLFGPEATAKIRAAILGLYNGQANALNEGEKTFTAQADTTSTQLTTAGGAAIRAPGDAAEAAKQSAVEKIKQSLAAVGAASTLEGGTLAGNLEGQATALSEAQRGVFNAQKDQIEAQTAVLRNVIRQSYQLQVQEHRHGVYGKPDGLIPTIERIEINVSASLVDLFQGVRDTLGTQTGITVSRVDTLAGDLRESLNGLQKSMTASNGAIGALGANGGRKPKIPRLAAGGLVKRPTLAIVGEAGPELVVPLNKINELVSAALSDMTYQPSGGFNVSGASADIIKAVRDAGKSEAAAFKGAGSAKAAGIRSETEEVLRALEAQAQQQRAFIKKHGKRKSKASDEDKASYRTNKDALLAFERDTFDLISGKALTGYHIAGRKDGQLGGLLGGLLGGKVSLFKGLTDAQKGVIDFATSFGGSLEQAVFSGVSSGFDAATGTFDAAGLTESLFGSVSQGLFDKLLPSLLSSTLGPLLTDITADVTGGDVAGATKGVEQIAAQLPGLLGQLESVFAPLAKTFGNLGIGQKKESETDRNTAITIESPLADLSSIISLSGAAAQVSAAIGRTASASAASQTFSAQGSTLPAYQKQLDATDGMDSHVSDFGGHVSRFGGWVTRLERIASQQQRPHSNLVDKARGQSLSVFNLTR